MCCLRRSCAREACSVRQVEKRDVDRSRNRRSWVVGRPHGGSGSGLRALFAVQGTSDGRRQAGLERNLGILYDGELGHPGTFGTARAFSATDGCMGCGSRRTEHRGGRKRLPSPPWAAEKQRENFKNRMVVKVSNDPSQYDTGDRELQCYRPGIPRANYMPYPFQIFQTPEEILMVYEFKGAVSSIHMDRSEEAPGDTWMGWSNGKWDGESLVVDVTGFNGNTWLDRSGNFHSNELKVVERWTPLSPYHMEIRGDPRGSEGLHAPVQDDLPALSSCGRERSADRVQLCTVRRGNDVRPPGTIQTATEAG